MVSWLALPQISTKMLMTSKKKLKESKALSNWLWRHVVKKKKHPTVSNLQDYCKGNAKSTHYPLSRDPIQLSSVFSIRSIITKESNLRSCVTPGCYVFLVFFLKSNFSVFPLFSWPWHIFKDYRSVVFFVLSRFGFV